MFLLHGFVGRMMSFCFCMASYGFGLTQMRFCVEKEVVLNVG